MSAVQTVSGVSLLCRVGQHKRNSSVTGEEVFGPFPTNTGIYNTTLQVSRFYSSALVELLLSITRAFLINSSFKQATSKLLVKACVNTKVQPLINNFPNLKKVNSFNFK